MRNGENLSNSSILLRKSKELECSLIQQHLLVKFMTFVSRDVHLKFAAIFDAPLIMVQLLYER